MRVLHCIYDDPDNPWVGGGGAERVYEIYRRLTDDVEVTVLAGGYRGATDGARDGVRYEFVGRRWPYALSRASYGRAATRRLARGDYDVAVFDFSVYTPIRVPAERPVAHVVHMPIGPSAAGRFGRLVGGVIERREQAMLRRARFVSTTSEWMAAQLRALVPEGGRVAVIRSGVADRFFAVERREQDHLLFYGRFDWYQKGVDVLLEAAHRLLADHPELRLVIAGRGKDAARVRAAAQSSPHRARIEIVSDPAPDRVLELMGGALLLLHPSRFEGYPVVPAEAMAAGVPVVATDVGAVGEIIGRPPAGRLVRAGDAGRLGAVAASLLDSPERRREMSELGRRHARDYRWDRVARDHLAFLAEVAAAHRPTAASA